MEQTYTSDDVMAMGKRFRATFINCLSGFKSGNLVGTISDEGVYNLSIFNSIVHIGANPPYLGMISRPTTVPRHTYSNIKSQGYYTLNLIHQNFISQAHQTSAKYDANVSEFETCGLTPQLSSLLPAPYVQESLVKFGLQFEEEHHIKANDTLLIVGKVIEIKLPEDVIEEDGFVDLGKLNTLAVTGLDAYYRTELVNRMAYARPEQEPKVLT